MRYFIFVLLIVSAVFSQYEDSNETMKKDFNWPNGAKVAISITFDDARPSQLDVGLPILDKHDVKATFYISPNAFEERLDDWKQAHKNGHEVANHSMIHPCSGNYPWARHKALEEYTLDKMETELIEANAYIKNHVGEEPVSFAYPCGQSYVGRGADLQSYIPLVSGLFLTARGWKNSYANDPTFCDLANLAGRELDLLSFDQALVIMEDAKDNGFWLIWGGHNVGEQKRQTILSETLEQICIYAKDQANEIWIDTVGNIGKYIKENR